MSKKVLWITRTAIMIALLIAAQSFSAAMGQLVTGSLVNLILIVSVMAFGWGTGFTVAILSPAFAKFLGIGPQLWPFIPFIALGNAVLICVWRAVGELIPKIGAKRFINYIAAAIVGAIAKFIVLYLTVVKIVIPFLVTLPEQQAAAMSNMFTLPQLITALIGGGIAAVALPLILPTVLKDKKD
ncbi:MAG: hypothetical protein LBL96_01435 [Clostridiales bacterium]|jgi:hypothetical protein|nr:hypothetical protein [Clostridiales bacterium]